MTTKMHRLLFSALVAIAGAQPLTGRATISYALSSVQPSTSMVALGQTQPLVLHWRVTSLLAATGPYTVTSSVGSFVGTDTLLGTVHTALSAAGVATAIRTPTTVRLTESLTVPAGVVLRAHQLGASFIRFQRQFNDGSGPVNLDATIAIGGSGAAQLAITREALNFDDGSALRVVQAGGALSAAGQISFIGAGSLSAVWEIAGPSSTPGQPQFRPLAQVTLGLLGHGPVLVKSPPLPTDAPGYYVARLRLTHPLPGFETPQLQYYVGGARSAHAGVASMVLTAPGDGAVFGDDTRFSWEPVSGAKAYQVELFASPAAAPDAGASSASGKAARARSALATPPAAGVIVAAPRTEVVLSPLSRARLRPHGTYFWRVQAIGADGAVIGSAQARELRVP